MSRNLHDFGPAAHGPAVQVAAYELWTTAADEARRLVGVARARGAAAARASSRHPLRLRLGAASLTGAFALSVVGLNAAGARSGRPAVADPPLVRASVATDAEPTTSSTAAAPTSTLPARRSRLERAAPAIPLPPPPTTTTTVVVPPPTPPELPDGKGMWIWKPEKTEGGNAAAIVAKAKATGLSHIFVRTGSTWDGFNAAEFLSRILPAAHNAGLKVYGWDFPKLERPDIDVTRALGAIRYTAPGGNHLDGFAPDIETASEGTRISAPAASAYGSALRAGVGHGYLLIGVVPRPSPQRASYPYAAVVSQYDVIAPMVYWLNREPGSDVAGAIAFLRVFGKPISPVGQAYDGKAEGGRPGVPPPAELLRFMRVASAGGAVSVSFWDWQEANAPAWNAIRDASEFKAHSKK